MQRQFQQFVKFQLHADLGTHSANCAADRGDLTSTVLWWLLPCLLLCKGRCSGGSRVKLWSLCSCSACGRRPVPGQGCCARGATSGWFDSGYIFCVSSRRALWTIFHIFLA